MEEKQGPPGPPTQNQLPVCPYSLNHGMLTDSQDDLSLAGIWRVLANRWKVIATFAIFAVMAAAGYLFIATPMYEAQVVLLPPESSHIEGLNIPETSEMSADEVYAAFARNLKSNALRRRFFDENGLLSVLDGDRSASEETIFKKQFSDCLKVKQGTRDQKDLIFVTFEGSRPQRITNWVNEFVAFAASSTVEEVVEGISTRIANQRDNLRERIEIARQWAKQRREDRIAAMEERLTVLRNGGRRQDRITLLEEQIAIARELKIIDRDDAPLRTPEGEQVALNVTTASEPLYLRGVTELLAEKEAIEKREDDDPFLPGVRELVAELEVLKARTNDDPFIPELRDKEEEAAQLEAGLAQLEGAASTILPARIDRKAKLPQAPSKPNKTRILPLSLVAGLLLGVFAAFQVHALEQARK